MKYYKNIYICIIFRVLHQNRRLSIFLISPKDITTKNHVSCGVYFCISQRFQTSLFTRATLFENVVISAATKYNMAFSCQMPLQMSLYTLYKVAF